MSRASQNHQQLELLPQLSLPSWIEGETLFSLCSRYHQLFGSVSPDSTAIRLFGRRNVGHQHDVPSGLDAFVLRTRGVLGDPRSIIQQRTIVPFYLHFLPRERQAAVMASMRSNSLARGKNQLGLIRAGFRATHILKVCPGCMEQDRTLHAVAFWHRDHQAPGVWICLKHEELLREASIKSNGYRYFNWALPIEEWARDEAPQRQLAALDKHGPALAGLARLIESLFTLDSGFAFTPDLLIRTAKSRLRENGDLTNQGQVRLQAVAEKYLAHCRQFWVFPYLDGLPKDASQAHRHLARMLQSAGRHVHPLKWLTLIQLLFTNWQDFWGRYQSVLKQSSDPGSGEGDSADACTTTELYRRKDRLIAFLKAGRSLREAAEQSGLRMETAKNHCLRSQMLVSEILEDIPVSVQKRILSLLAKGSTIRQVSTSVKLKISQVRRVAISRPELLNRFRMIRKETLRRKWRAQVTKLIRRNPAMSRSEIRAECLAGSTWLLRHDRQWLLQALPPKRGPAAARQMGLKLNERDAALARRVSSAAPAIYARHGYGRVRQWMIRQAVPDVVPAIAKPKRWPKTRRAIESLILPTPGLVSKGRH